ncbi:signal recognition particle-docking protein FtsY [Halobacteriovorax sp. HLS]|uniref:signal recognition particle-docking protein FtsY n=1 Tax=Halobacteriovorax sp. HLS TaxID=2234000 RepID=UPI0013E3F0DB|nr:signal recognition particle-docking protein FtsY [Halobacteriovorax sp. HLS]
MNSIINLLQSLYMSLGLTNTVNEGDVFGLGLVLTVLILALLQLGTTKSKVPSDKAVESERVDSPVIEQKADPVESKKEELAPVVEAVPTISWKDRLKKGLSKSSSEVWGKIGNIFTGKTLDDETLEEVEELLYGADIGPTIAAELIEALESESKKEGFGESEFKLFLKSFLSSKMSNVQNDVDTDLYQFDESKRGKTKVIMIVGVNGAGKTTTIGKLATKLTGQGAKVVVGACDTFRAAAVDQLQVWCERAGAQMIRAKEGANPSGVGYDALQQALNSGADYCILDTAGRLHTKGNLMEELTKSKEVLKKLDENAPHQTLLVIDAITGQNAIRQAEEFNNALSLNGLIFTKCDGSSKAGSAIGIVDKLKVPITYIGVGEHVEDLNIFNLDEYLNALLNLE